MSSPQKKLTEKPIGFQLKVIELLDFSLINPKKVIPPHIVFNFDIKIEHKILAENNFVAVVVTVDIYGDQKEQKYGSLMASCIFEVKELKEYIAPPKNIPELPETFMTAVNSTSISTVRGILFSQLRGTFLHNAILPVVDPKSFVAQ